MRGCSACSWDFSAVTSAITATSSGGRAAWDEPKKVCHVVLAHEFQFVMISWVPQMCIGAFDVAEFSDLSDLWLCWFGSNRCSLKTQQTKTPGTNLALKPKTRFSLREELQWLRAERLRLQQDAGRFEVLWKLKRSDWIWLYDLLIHAEDILFGTYTTCLHNLHNNYLLAVVSVRTTRSCWVSLGLFPQCRCHRLVFFEMRFRSLRLAFFTQNERAGGRNGEMSNGYMAHHGTRIWMGLHCWQAGTGGIPLDSNTNDTQNARNQSEAKGLSMTPWRNL